MKRIVLSNFIKVALILVILGLIGVLIGLYSYSFTMVKENPELAHMRLPVFGLCVGILGSPIIACILGFLALIYYGNGRLFYEKTGRYLVYTGHCFILGVLFLGGLFVYTAMNVAGSITNLYVMVGIFIYLLVGAIFYLLGDVIAQGKALQEDHDLTI